MIMSTSNTHSAARVRHRVQSTINPLNVNSAVTLVSQAKDEHKAADSIDARLADQFKYFRKELMESAQSHGVTVPLDILEDTTGRIFNFVKHQGPKYVFQIIQSNGDNTHLLRCALSLLIVTLSILKRRLLPSKASTHDILNPVTWSQAVDPVDDSISVWAEKALAQISDGGAVSICISLVTTTHVPAVQELVLTLLASIVSTSDEAANQMFLMPNSYSRSNNKGYDNNNNNNKNSSTKDVNSSNNNSTITPNMTVGKKKKVSISSAASTSKSNTFIDPSLTNNIVMPSDSMNLSTAPGTCLSLMLSVAALHRNRHLIMAGCAETIIALTKSFNKDICDAVLRTPTCSLPAEHSGDERKQSDAKASLKSSYQNSKLVKKLKGTVLNASQKIYVDHAGIKILIKFLSRFFNFNHYEVSHYVPSRERDELSFAYTKVVHALCHLLVGSAKIVDFICHWDCASETFVAAAKKVISQPAGQPLIELVDKCLSLINSKVRQIEQERVPRFSIRHSDVSISDVSQGSFLINDNNYSNNNHHNNNNNNNNNHHNNNRNRNSNNSPSRLNSPSNRLFQKVNKPNSPSLGADLPNMRPYTTQNDASLIKYINMTGNGEEIRPLTGPSRINSSNINVKRLGTPLSRPGTSGGVLRPGTSHSRPGTGAIDNEYNVNNSVITNNNSVSSSFSHFFNSLPNTPNLPPRLSQESIDSNDVRGRVRSYGDKDIDDIAEKAVNKLKDMGLMYNGKPYLAREEQYRRVYTPDLPLDMSSRSRPLTREGPLTGKSESIAETSLNESNDNDNDNDRMSLQPLNKEGEQGEAIDNVGADNRDNFGFFKQASAGIGFKLNEINFEESDMMTGFKPIYEISDQTLARQSFRIENSEEDDSDINYNNTFDWNISSVDGYDASNNVKPLRLNPSTAEISADIM